MVDATIRGDMRYFIGDVAVDEKAVYWNQPGWTNHPGGIVKVAKP